jgi:hypothetical protein
LITHADFTEGQVQFFSANCEKFADDEENKHEYKEIHEEYIVNLEQAIEAVLKNKFSDDQINGFYEDFAANYGTYKG